MSPSPPAAPRNERAAVSVRIVVGSLEVGGTERQLVAVLPRLAAAGLQVRVQTLTGRGALAPALTAEGVPVTTTLFAEQARRLPKVLRRPLLVPLALVGLWLDFLVDRRSITCFFLPEAYLVGMLAASLAFTRAPRVLARRSLNAYQARRPLLGFLERKAHRWIAAATGNSAAILRELRAEGIPPEKLAIIPNGVADMRLVNGAHTRGAVRSELDIAADALVLICVANLIPYKGHADLLRAVAGIRTGLPEGWRLLCVGRDEGIGAGLRSLAVDLGIDEHLRWLGARGDVRELLAAADLAVLASHEEGFSNTVLEGMSAGLPVVATDVGGNAEAVEQGRTGLLVPARDPRALGEALLTLARDRGRAARLGAAGRQRVLAQFSLEACTGRHLALFEAVAGHAPLPAELRS